MRGPVKCKSIAFLVNICILTPEAIWATLSLWFILALDLFYYIWTDLFYVEFFFPPNVYLAAPSLSGSMQDLSVQFSRSVVSNSETPWAAARQASLSITNSQSLLKLMSIESVMPSNHLVLCHPLLPSSIFPASGSFPVNQFIASGGQSTGTSTSASVLPMNIQYSFPSGWTCWISLQSKGLWRVFSNTTVQKHIFFGAQLSL